MLRELLHARNAATPHGTEATAAASQTSACAACGYTSGTSGTALKTCACSPSRLGRQVVSCELMPRHGGELTALHILHRRVTGRTIRTWLHEHDIVGRRKEGALYVLALKSSG